MQVLHLVKQIPEFKDVPEDQLAWLVDKSECLEIKKGAYLFEPGGSINRLLLIVAGGFTLKIPRNNQFLVVGRIDAPSISGLLPYSRADVAKGYAEAQELSQVVCLDGGFFKDMITECHELTTALVHTMSTRIRQFTKREQQDDKMMSLGKLSAGLAHELNNPSAAVVRSSKALSKHLKFLPEKFKNVIKIQMSDERIDRVNEILFEKIKTGIKELPMLQRSSLEDEMIEWLYDKEVEDPEDLVDNFVDYGFSIKDLEMIGEDTPLEHQPPVLNWVNQMLSTERLVSEIEEASQRISDLVLSIKSYTHMDQAPDKIKTDIHTGIDNTLIMLNHKLQDSKIEIRKEYGDHLPQTEILPGAINQVWTNLLDNAIDAMEESEHKVLTIHTCETGDYLKVQISDTGSGISDEVKDKIFDPFFTTKPIGKGTGLGLENVHQIVRIQHNGLIDVVSEPGNTIFTICLPIKAT